MREGSPMFESFKQKQREEEELKNKKEEKRSRFRKIAENLAIGGALVGTLTAGTVGYEKVIAPQNEKIMKDYDANAEKKFNEENALREVASDSRAGYVSLEHYLEDYPEVRQNPEKLEKARKYFEAGEKK